MAGLFELSTGRGAQAAGNCGRGTILPGADNHHYQAKAENQSEEGQDVGGAVEALGSGSSENSGTVFLHEALLDQAVAVAARDGSHEFVPHAVGGRAADVIAFQKDLVAAADAHHLVADFSEASG